MINPIYTLPSECSGCRACVEVCPKQCITMVKDAERFVYPKIDESACIDCHRCEKVCPLKDCSLNTILESVVGVHTPEEVFKSASGGAFWALCQVLIPLGYVVAGVKWADGFNVVHDIAYTLEEAEAFRKSKYVMPDTHGVFAKVKALLKEGRKVMFTGSPCQVAACKKFVGNSDNLLLVDLVCHGAPNQDIFDKEVEYLESKHNGKLESFEFRQKKPIEGKVNSRSARYVVDGNEYVVGINNDPFLKGYYTRLFYRPSCGTCHFARPERVGDITIADAWGFDQLNPHYNELKGVSLILINSIKGCNVKYQLESLLDLFSVDNQWAIENNQQLQRPTSMHVKRALFFRKMEENSFNDIIAQIERTTLMNRIKPYIKRLLS